MEALRVLVERLKRETPVRVVLWTSAGCVEGELTDISESYEQARGDRSVADVDVASAVVHLRSELWEVYAARDASLTPVDAAPILHVRNAVVRVGSRRVRVPHMAVLANSVVGFSLTEVPVV